MNNSSQEVSNKETRLQKIKEEAALWLVELEDCPSDAEKRASFKQWYNADEDHKKYFIKLAETWNSMHVLSELAFVSKKTHALPEAHSGVVSTIKAMWGGFFDSETTASDNAGRTLSLKSGLALSLVFSVILITAVFQSNFNQPNSQIYASNYGEQQKKTLSDGSVIWINSNSQVTVQYDNERRLIRLDKGEAFFEVAKDPERPFEVYSGDKLARAIGTAFSVYQDENSVEVLVSEGIVEFGIVQYGDSVSGDKAELTDKNGTKVQTVEILGELVANQQVTIEQNNQTSSESYDAQILQLNEEDVKNELMWIEGKLVFKGEPLEEVVKEISRHLSIRIDIPDSELKKIKIEGHFEAGNTESLFFVLENGFNIDVTYIDKDHVELKPRQ